MKGLLLLNLGTPDSPSVSDVRKYLREFLMDKYVIDLPYLTRWFLVNVIIATFRAPKSAKVYQELWTEKGSPLLYLGKELQQLVQDKLGDEMVVEFGMRYQNPSIISALERLKSQGIDDLVVIPMYPQWASSTTKSSIEKVEEDMKKIGYAPKVRFIDQFLEHPKFVEAFAELGNQYYKAKEWDKVLFSFHGVPERHVSQHDPHNYCKFGSCCDTYTDKNKYCYRAQCFHTARQIADKMGIPKDKFEVVFQSRLETRARDPWLQPYADLVIEKLPEQGDKKVLAFSPSFVADCLETTIEVGDEFKEIFEDEGGEDWQLVESLNTSPKWVECLVDMAKN